VSYLKPRPIVNIPFTENSPYVDFLFTKYHTWSDENEHRILRFLSGAADSKDDICLFSLPPSTIKEIIFGCHSDETKEPSVEPTLKIVRSNPALSHVKIKKAKLASRGYAVNIVDFL
jgi:hypothetical protein